MARSSAAHEAAVNRALLVRDLQDNSEDEESMSCARPGTGTHFCARLLWEFAITIRLVLQPTLAIFAAAHLFDAAVWAATIVSGAAPRVQRWLLLVLWGMRLLLAPLMRMPLPVRQQEEMGDCQFWVKS